MKLPYLIDEIDAIEYVRDNSLISKPALCYVIKQLVNANYSNSQIREITGIEKDYACSHYIRVAKVITEEELELWSNNEKLISLGHFRLIYKIDNTARINLVRKILSSKLSIKDTNAIINEDSTSTDLKRYCNTVSEQLGRKLSIKYNSEKETGQITMDFYKLQDLENIFKQLGYKQDNLF